MQKAINDNSDEAFGAACSSSSIRARKQMSHPPVCMPNDGKKARFMSGSFDILMGVCMVFDWLRDPSTPAPFYSFYYAYILCKLRFFWKSATANSDQPKIIKLIKTLFQSPVTSFKSKSIKLWIPLIHTLVRLDFCPEFMDFRKLKEELITCTYRNEMQKPHNYVIIDSLFSRWRTDVSQKDL